MPPRWRSYDLPGNLDEPISYSPHQYNQLREIIGTEDCAQNELNIVEAEIEQIAARLNVDDTVKDEAMRIYRYAIQTNLVNNYSMGALMAAATYTACRNQRAPYTLSDIEIAAAVPIDPTREGEVRREEWSSRDEWYFKRWRYNEYPVLGLARRKTILRVYNRICDKLGKTYLPIDAEKFVHRYGNELKLDANVVEFAQVAVSLVDNRDIKGTKPSTIAAGAIYYATEEFDLDLSYHKIEFVTHIGTTAIRNARDLIKESIEPS